MRRRSDLAHRYWLLWTIAGAALPWIIAFLPTPGRTVASPSDLAVRPAPPTDRAAAIRRQLDELEARLEQEIAERQKLLADLESIADLVPPEYRLLCVEVAREYGLEPRILAALGRVESRWNPQAVGSAGEVGVMQILPETAAWLAEQIGLQEYDLTDPATNLRLGAAYLRYLIDTHGSVDEALAAYNAGPQWRERAPQAARSYVDRVRVAAEGAKN